MLRWQGLDPEDPARVKRAAAVLAHRGPDGEGLWHDTHCALGFRRLKVIDLSPAGDQPMANEDGTLRVVFNGEIYNFRELRAELEKSGHAFRSKSDTEVLLHGYEQWGIDALLPKLRGMFAFALWDAPKRRLVLARDPLGVKPLYFAERGDSVLFASEPKALFATGLVEAEIDPVAVHEALTYRYVPAPRSGFHEVEKLPPGSLADAVGRMFVYRRWWKPPTDAEAWKNAARGMTAMQQESGMDGIATWIAEHRWEGVLRAAVKRRLLADVPLGAWLSGGIDSGLVASFMEPGMRSFAAGFAQPEWDERALATATAAHLKAQHTAFEVPADVFKFLPQVVWHADEPFFDSSCLPAFALAERTKPLATVVLSGDGGDEAFAGYQRYAGMKYYTQWMKTPRFLRACFVALAKALHPTPSRQGWDRLVRWLEKCRQTEEERFPPYVSALTLFDQAQARALYHPEFAVQTDGLDAREDLANALKRAAMEIHNTDEPGKFCHELGVQQRADLVTYLPGDVLHKVDRMSMAHGVEVRSPFLDVDLVTLALSIPDAVRMPGKRTKPLLRALAGERLPPQVAQSTKRGFGVPLDEWFRGALRKEAQARFEDSHLATDGIFRPRYWENLWNEHQAGTANHGERLYALLALELWHRTFLSGKPVLERPAPLG
ncbi:MAG: asparagine synthase (glutamine-hydrolyzing) [Planctomycetes bacterium]|nr:asparagine synthase (glutamine-hydrolyzing) [Planctomycetota bacterium]